MPEEKESMLKRLQSKWQLKSLFQTIMVLIVFAVTGSTVLFIKPLLFDLVGLESFTGFWSIVLYIVLIFPLYQILILVYGFIFGQFEFFWKWEKAFFNRITGKSRRDRRNTHEAKD